MPSKVHIVVGCRVEGAYGNFGSLVPGKQRRRRERVIGTVIAPIGHNKWKVLFDFDGKEQEASSKSLKVIDAQVGIPLDRNEVSATSTIIYPFISTLTNALYIVLLSISFSIQMRLMK